MYTRTQLQTTFVAPWHGLGHPHQDPDGGETKAWAGFLQLLLLMFIGHPALSGRGLGAV